MIIQPDDPPAPPAYDAIYGDGDSVRSQQRDRKTASSASTASLGPATSPVTPSASSSTPGPPTRLPSQILRRKLEQHRRTVSIMRIDILVFITAGILFRLPRSQRLILSFFSTLSSYVPSWFSRAMRRVINDVFLAGFESNEMAATVFACMVVIIVLLLSKMHWRTKHLDELEDVVRAAERSEAQGNIEDAKVEIWRYIDEASNHGTRRGGGSKGLVLINIEPVVHFAQRLIVYKRDLLASMFESRRAGSAQEVPSVPSSDGPPPATSPSQ